MRSFISIGMGILLSLGVGLLTIFGIIWPLFMTFFDAEIGRNAVLGYVLMVFAAAFSFYWGGMISSYKSPFRPRLHGTIVAPAAFVISPILNLSTGNGLFPGLDSIAGWTIMLGVLSISIAAAYIGARRGEKIWSHNQSYIRKRELRREHQRRQSQES